MKSWSVCMICSMLCLAVAGCQGLAGKENTTPRAPDYWPTNGWKTSTPERLGMDSGKLADMFAAIESRHLHPGHGDALPEPHLGAAAGPGGHSRGRAAGGA